MASIKRIYSDADLCPLMAETYSLVKLHRTYNQDIQLWASRVSDPEGMHTVFLESIRIAGSAQAIGLVHTQEDGRTLDDILLSIANYDFTELEPYLYPEHYLGYSKTEYQDEPFTIHSTLGNDLPF